MACHALQGLGIDALPRCRGQVGMPEHMRRRAVQINLLSDAATECQILLAGNRCLSSKDKSFALHGKQNRFKILSEVDIANAALSLRRTDHRRIARVRHVSPDADALLIKVDRSA